MIESTFSHTYPNGLVLVAEPMDWLESAAFSFSVPLGTVNDPLDQGGLSGFVCEMVLRGAGQRDAHQFIEDLDALGVDHGQSVTDAHTNFSGASLAENLVPAIEIFAQVLRHPHMLPEQLEASRQVMLQELFAVEDEPSQKVMLELRKRHYPPPWGRPFQGELKAIQHIAINDVRKYFEIYYRPNGTILGVAGRFDWTQLKESVGELLGDWQSNNVPKIAELPTSGPYEHLPHESNQTHIGIAYKSVPYRDPRYFQAWGGVGVLSGGMSSRLFTEVRERRGLCYSVYALCHTLKDRGAVFCYAGTSADRAQETLDVTLGELTKLEKGIVDSELARLKARIKSALIMQQESSAARSGSIARDWYHLGRARSMDELARLVDELTYESINAYLTEHPPADFTIVTLGPQELEVPVGVS